MGIITWKGFYSSRFNLVSPAKEALNDDAIINKQQQTTFSGNINSWVYKTLGRGAFSFAFDPSFKRRKN